MKRILSMLLVFVMVLGCALCFADESPDITIVNPISASSVSSDNLLVSVKIAKAVDFRVSVEQVMRPAAAENALPTAITLVDYENNLKAEEANKIVWVNKPAMESERVSNTAELSYYTKKIENVTPGVYLIKVETLGESADAETVLTVNSAYVEVAAKTEADSDPAAAQQSGALTFLKTLLVSIFGK